MATGVLMNYGSSMVVGALGNMAMGAGTRAVSGQGSDWSDVGSDAGGGALGSGMGTLTGGGAGGLSSMIGSSFAGGGSGGGGLTSLMGQGIGGLSNLMGTGSGTAGATGSATGSSGSLLTSGFGSSASGLMDQFGQSIFSSSEKVGDAQYNSKMTELRNYNTMQHGIYNRAASYKEAELVNQEAEMRLAALRRELYRREHSIGAHKGVRLDSGSIIDVNEDLVKQANYDAEIVKYQAAVDSGRYIDQGNMSVWTAHSTSVLNKNIADNSEEQVRDDASKSIMNSGMSAFNSALSSSK